MYIFLGVLIVLIVLIVITYFLYKIGWKMNPIAGASISDVLIGYTLSLMGKSKKDVEDYFTEVKLTFNKYGDNFFFTGILRNRYELVITLTNEKVSKIIINSKGPHLEKDLFNLNLFSFLHHKDYDFKEAHDKKLGHMIAFQAK